MDRVGKEEERFEAREIPMPDLSNERIFPGRVKVKAVFEAEMKWRLVEEFGPRCFEETENGKLLFQADYTDAGHMVRWLLTFGEKVKVTEPEEVRQELLRDRKSVV